MRGENVPKTLAGAVTEKAGCAEKRVPREKEREREGGGLTPIVNRTAVFAGY